jgi:hypothetical protein
MEAKRAQLHGVIGVGFVARCASGIGRGGANWLASFVDGAFPPVFVIGHTVVNDRLNCCGRQRVATKAEVLNSPVVGGQEGPEHKAYLQCRVNGNAPHSEAGKPVGKMRLELNDRLILRLFDVDKIKYVAE